MNIGFYINNLGNQDQIKHINDQLNSNINITDASIFFDDIGFNPYNTKCGTFNSTDLWNFKGHLVVTSLEGLFNATNIVNDINLYYYHGWEDEINVLLLLKILSENKVKLISKNQEGADYLYRITGHKSIGNTDNQKILELIKE